MPALSIGSVFEALGKLPSLIGAKEYVHVQPIIADFMQKFTVLHADNERLTEENAALKKEVSRSKEFRAEAKKYRANTEDTGVVTYALKQPADAQEQMHRFCANCFKSLKVRYLQPTKKTELINHLSAWFRVHDCHECTSSVTFGKTQNYNPPSSYSRRHSDF